MLLYICCRIISNIHHVNVNMEIFAISGEKLEPPIPRSNPIMMRAAEEVGGNLINLILQGLRMQVRVVCGQDHFHHVVMPLTEGIEAVIIGRCTGFASTLPKFDVVGDEAES